MKLRIRGNSLRLRLTKGEVDAIGSGQTVTEQTRFPGGAVLSYQLIPGAARGAVLSTTDLSHAINITVPSYEANTWANDETAVGLSGDAPFLVDDLEILIEKDFTCVTPRAGEEELDTFPNPNIA